MHEELPYVREALRLGALGYLSKTGADDELLQAIETITAGDEYVGATFRSRLAELPPDCDPVEGLLRIALQGRVPKRVLPEAVLAEGRWAPIRSRHQLAELEPGWFRRHAAAPDWRAPGRALARLAVRSFGGRMLERGLRPELFTALGVAVSAAGIACDATSGG